MSELDLFSGVAREYSRFRMGYPEVLYEQVLQPVKTFNTAWDVATGNGQVARDLATRFRSVIATDFSESQLLLAPPSDNITYRKASAEKSGLEADSIDCITVGQAAHWFDFPAFCHEVERVATSDAVLAIWCYGLFRSPEPVNELVRDFYFNTIGPYWHPRRQHIDNGYKDLDAPFDLIQWDSVLYTVERSLGGLQGYLGTWSAVQAFREQVGYDPVKPLMEKIEQCIGTDAVIDCETRFYYKVWRVT